MNVTNESIPDKGVGFHFQLSVIQLVSLIMSIVALACTLTINMLSNKKLFELELWEGRRGMWVLERETRGRERRVLFIYFI